jgi:response regulator of citrate/malate metabolism
MELMTFENRLPTREGAYLGLPERRKFLVVEDDFAAQPIWEKIIKLVDPKAIIFWATTEEGAEKMIENREKYGDSFDFVIADIFLAGPKTGIDLWKRFSRESMQFLFISSITRNKFLEMVGEHVDRYPMLIRKPFNVKECVDSLFVLLKSNKYFKIATRH